jgi:hypothetical protein
MSALPEFVEFPKMARLSRDIVVTEKIDGTNAQVHITLDGEIFAGSRSRWITPEADNFGFARWVYEHRDELLTLGPGSHFGEWWGQGVQRGYGLNEKRWSLFNTSRWGDDERSGSERAVRPACCHVVPVLYQGPLSLAAIEDCLWELQERGSRAAPGFGKPEGVVVFHTAANLCFKKTILKDELPKALAGAA